MLWWNKVLLNLIKPLNSAPACLLILTLKLTKSIHQYWSVEPIKLTEMERKSEKLWSGLLFHGFKQKGIAGSKSELDPALRNFFDIIPNYDKFIKMFDFDYNSLCPLASLIFIDDIVCWFGLKQPYHYNKSVPLILKYEIAQYVKDNCWKQETCSSWNMK